MLCIKRCSVYWLPFQNLVRTNNLWSHAQIEKDLKPWQECEWCVIGDGVKSIITFHDYSNHSGVIANRIACNAGIFAGILYFCQVSTSESFIIKDPCDAGLWIPAGLTDEHLPIAVKYRDLLRQFFRYSRFVCSRAAKVNKTTILYERSCKWMPQSKWIIVSSVGNRNLVQN